MKRLVKLAVFLLGLGLLMPACTPTPVSPCGTEVVATIDPSELESAPPPAAFAEDPLGDHILYDPLFQENFDVGYAEVPPALDIVAVEVGLEGQNYYFRVQTAGDNVRELLLERERMVQFGIFVDTDLNGLSDFLLITTGDPERGVVISRDFERVEEMPLDINANSVTMFAPIGTLGEHFEWVAFTGYSPEEEAYYLTPLEDLFIVPIVDMAYADMERTTLVFTSLSGTGKQCQVTDMGISFCPPSGNPPGQEPLPGPTGPHPSDKGWMFWQKKCGDLKIELWCYGAFGRRVEKGSNKGWIARCPFKGGQNFYKLWDNYPSPNGDGVPDRVRHWVQNGKFYWGFDDDGDGCWDWMDFDYSFDTNLVTILNLEFDSGKNLVVTDPDPASPHKPYDWPWDVPGTHTGAPTHPPGTCP